MRISLSPRRREGFTLAELMVAMGITAIILTLLVSITGVALDGWRISRNKVRASRQAKAALDQMSRDFESMVVRSGNNFEWLHAESASDTVGPDGGESPSAASLIFFTAATDRYLGKIGSDSDQGGDVSGVAYELMYRDPIGDSESSPYAVFALYRQLIDPKTGENAGTFYDLLATDDLENAFSKFSDDQSDSTNFVCENIYQISVVFMIEYSEEKSGRLVSTQVRVPVMAAGGADSVTEFKITGSGIEVQGDDDPDYARGRIVAADLSLSVLTDSAISRLRQGTATEKYLNQNTYHYMKTVLLPQP